MNMETANTIIDDIKFMASTEETTQELLLSINGYLLALSRHKVITAEEQRALGTLIFKTLNEPLGEDAEC